MTVAVSCNLSDGVILGVDSAVSLAGDGGSVGKVYENAEKLFQLGTKPVGIAIFGSASIANRTVGSYLREFEHLNIDNVVTGESSMSQIAESLRSFFMDLYRRDVIPGLEQTFGKKFPEIPIDKRPGFGFVVGGFSAGKYLSEGWAVLVPVHEQAGSAQQAREPGQFGANWFAFFEPIRRYVKGFDPALVDELTAYFLKTLGR